MGGIRITIGVLALSKLSSTFSVSVDMFMVMFHVACVVGIVLLVSLELQ